MRKSKQIVALVVIATWMLASLSLPPLLLAAGALMSLDNAWAGWQDLLLNPYLLVPYAGLTASAWISWLSIRRTERRNN